MNVMRIVVHGLSPILLIVQLVGCGRLTMEPIAIPTSQLSVITPIVELRTSSESQSSHELAVIRVKNTGSSPVAIAGVNTGCGCAVVNDLPQVPLITGEITDITIRVRMPEFGEQRLVVSLETSPPSTTVLQAVLMLHGKSWPIPKLVHPLEDMRISNVRSGIATLTFAVQTWEKPGSEPWLRGFQSDSNLCRVMLSEPPVEKELTTGLVERRYLARLEVDAVASPEELQIVSVVPAFNPQAAIDASFRVLIEAKSKIRAIPAVLNVSRDSLPTKRQVLFVSDPADWTCHAGEAWPEWVRLEAIDNISSPTQRAFRLTLAILPPIGTSLIEATIPVEITGADEPSVSIRITVGSK